MDGLVSLLAATSGGVSLGVQAVSSLAAVTRSRMDSGPASKDGPPVSILVPLKGEDAELEDNLAAFARQEYGSYEVVLVLSNPDDSAMPTALRIAAAFPERVRLLVGPDLLGSPNPKTNTLARAYIDARFPLIMHCDANLRLPPDGLARSVAALQPGIGLVTAIYSAARPSGFWANVECAFLNGLHAKFLAAAGIFGRSFALGKLMLYRRADLDRAGGYARLGENAAHDAALENVMRGLGLEIRALPRYLEHPLGRRTAKDVWQRQVRWLMVRRVNQPVAFAAEPLTSPILGFVYAYLAAPWLGIGEIWSVGAMAAMWYAIEGLVHRANRWPLSGLSPAAWLARDLLLPLMWVAAVTSRRAQWRGTEVEIALDGTRKGKISGRGAALESGLRGGEAHDRVPRSKPVACLVHVYYPDLWPELVRYMRNLEPFSADIRINIVKGIATESFVAAVRADCPEGQVRVSENRGRDIGGFFSLMTDLDFDRYEIICLLHTKKSPHLTAALGRRWRRGLLDAILGNPDRAGQNVRAMLTNPRIGIVAARRYRRTNISGNRTIYESLLDRLGIPKHRIPCEFVGGTIMMIRSNLLRQVYEGLRDVRFEDGDALALKQHVDGQTAHAVERVFGAAMHHNGLSFWWRKT